MTHELKPCPFCGEENELYPARRMAKDGTLSEAYAIDCLGCGFDFTPRESMDVFAAWNRRLSSTKSEPVAVKALEWKKSVLGHTLVRADTMLGQYRVWTHHEANGKWFMCAQGRAEEFATEQQALVAAQADYESRIRSALSKGGAQ